MRLNAISVHELRPIFFRIGNCRAWGGWFHPSFVRFKPVAFDIWTTPDILEACAKDVARVRPGIGVNLMLSEVNRHGLCLVRGAQPALFPSERLSFTADCDFHPSAYVDAGERAFVAHRDRTTGAVSLFLEHYKRGLEGSSNCITLEPHLVEDHILAALTVFNDPFVCPSILYVDDFLEHGTVVPLRAKNGG